MTGKFVFDSERAGESIFNNDGGVSQDEFQGCCGARIIYGFPIITESGAINDIQSAWQDQVEDWKNNIFKFNVNAKVKRASPGPMTNRVNCLKIFRDEFLYQINKELDIKSGRLYFIILNETQSWMGKYLKEKNFRLVSDRTVNKNSNERLYVYLYDPLNPKGETVKKRMFS